MRFDLLFRGGTVIDPLMGVHGRRDVGVLEGRVACVEDDLSSAQASRVVTLDDRDIVTPGLVDLHTHVYWGATPLGVQPDLVSRMHAVTTLVDAGSAGAANLVGFKEHIVDQTRARVFAFLNIAFPGIIAAVYSPGGESYVIVGENENLRYDMVEPAVAACLAFPDLVKGIKVRVGMEASGHQCLEPLRLALEVAAAVGKPLMAHVSVPPPTLRDVLPLLRGGDVLTHAFRGHPNAPLDRKGSVLDEIRMARERGVILDIGHGGGSFSWAVAARMMDQGFPPDVISSDIHLSTRFHPAWPGMPTFTMPETMSKMLSLGMDLDEVVRACTHAPAAVIGEEEMLGSLARGTPADISVFRVEEGAFTFTDPFDGQNVGTKRVVPGFAVVGGWLVEG